MARVQGLGFGQDFGSWGRASPAEGGGGACTQGLGAQSAELAASTHPAPPPPRAPLSGHPPAGRRSCRPGRWGSRSGWPSLPPATRPHGRSCWCLRGAHTAANTRSCWCLRGVHSSQHTRVCGSLHRLRLGRLPSGALCSGGCVGGKQRKAAQHSMQPPAWGGPPHPAARTARGLQTPPPGCWR